MNASRIALAALSVPAAIIVGRMAGEHFVSQASAADAAADQQLERGRYLVHHVAKCIECHTPRDAQGKLLLDRPLVGAIIPFRSPYSGSTWAFTSANIAGLGAFDRETVVSVLSRGRRPDGRVPQPPMPDFGMHEADARAIVAYLESLR